MSTESAKMFELNLLLRKYGLTEPQYNVMRILRGAGKDGLPCGRISERMLTRLPDITRLVDRLVARRYVTRAKSSEDRRVILIQIARRGLELLGQLDEPVLALHKTQFARLTKTELGQLTALLNKARGEPTRPGE